DQLQTGVVGGQQGAGDGQAQAGAALAPAGGEEGLEDAAVVGGGHAGAVVAEGQDQGVVVRRGAQGRMGRARLTAVLQQGRQDHFDGGGGDGDQGQVVGQGDGDLQRAGAGVDGADQGGADIDGQT